MIPSGSIGVKGGQSSESVGVCLFGVIEVFFLAVMDDTCMYQFSSVQSHLFSLVRSRPSVWVPDP